MVPIKPGWGHAPVLVFVLGSANAVNHFVSNKDISELHNHVSLHTFLMMVLITSSEHATSNLYITVPQKSWRWRGNEVDLFRGKLFHDHSFAMGVRLLPPRAGVLEGRLYQTQRGNGVSSTSLPTDTLLM